MHSESNGNQQAKKSDKNTDFFSVLYLVEFPKWALKFFSITGPIFTIVGFAMITIVAAPVVVALATGVALAGINAVSKAIFKKSATEVVSDAILDGAEAVGNAVKAGAKVVANWFKKPKFA